MKVVIIEDEQLAVRRLENMICQFDKTIEVLAKLESVEESVEWFRNNSQPDLIFLDIHLEDDLSFAIFDKVTVTAPIIFTTAYDEYAIKAFKLKSIDYLLKPIVQEELENAIIKYKQWHGQEATTLDLRSLMQMVTPLNQKFKDRFAVTVGTKIKSISIDDIAYFYSAEGISFMVLTDKHEYALDSSLDKIAEELDPKSFFRINRQYLIKLGSIANVHVYPKSKLKIDLLPSTKDTIYVSLDRVTDFKRWLDGTC